MRRHFVLLFSLVVWALLMGFAGSRLPKTDVKGISGAGLAMEFAQSQQDVDAILSPSDPELPAYKSTLVRLQGFDVVFIGLYWAVFFFTLAGPMSHSRVKEWRVLGLVARCCITVAALSDLAEDFGIVSLIGPFGLPHVWPFWFAVVKWTLIFVTLLLVAPYLIFCPSLFPAAKPRQGWVDGVVYGSAAFFGAAAFCGIAGVIGRFSDCGQLLLPGSLFMATGFLLLLVNLGWEIFAKPFDMGEPAASFKNVLKAELKEVLRIAALRANYSDAPESAGARDMDPTPRFPTPEKQALPPLDAAVLTVLEDEKAHGSTIQQAGRRNLLGLAFSGGGIRSATFNLGVLQGLAEHKFLRRFHYLSTVSGGGYIGSWLTAWISRQGMEEVEKRLREPRTNQPNFKEPPEIRFLREYSNYLTPRLGLFGLDTWTAIATYLRNLLLNQTVLVLFLAAAILVPRVVVAGAQAGAAWFKEPCYPIATIVAGLVALAALVIGRNMAYYAHRPGADRVIARVTSDAKDKTLLTRLKVAWLIPDVTPLEGESLLARVGRVEIWDQNIVRRKDVGHATRLADFDWTNKTLDLDIGVEDIKHNDLVVAVYPWTARQAGIFSLVTLPTFLAISLFTWLLAQTPIDTVRPFLPWPIIGAAAGAVAWLLGAVLVHRYALHNKTYTGGAALHVLKCTVASGLAGALAAVLLRQVALLLHKWMDSAPREWNVLGFGTPIVALVFLAFSVLQVGLLGTRMSEPRREWVGRLEAWILIISVAWAAAFTLAGYSPLFVLWLSQFPTSAWLTGLSWVGATLSGVLGGGSSKTSGIDATIKDKLLSLTPYIFAAGLLVLVSVGVNSVLSPGKIKQEAKEPGQVAMQMAVTSVQEVTVQVHATAQGKSNLPVGAYWTNFLGVCRAHVLWGFVICLLASLLLALRVDLNEFSMHYFYRNRLVRCYLGASHRERVPNPVTGFDDDDDLFLATLTADKGYDGPYPIVGCALNLVHGKDLAWQERKATSFVMTPQFCGYDVWFEKLLRPGQWEKRGQASDGYRPTSSYAYDRGVYVGTAMAISGAAASPNMGFHSTPALAFLMTVFNVRLGQWFGNPRDPRCWRNPAPKIGLGYLLAELFGATDDDSGYVYLSDGGHFENLGLYELVKRRCRFILASDAGEDKNLAFDDLASAIRKCRSDMGIDIEIKTDKILKVGTTQFSYWHCAIGLIKYSNSDPPLMNLPSGPGNTVKDGVLVYIKPSLTKDESADVLNYQALHPAFPHQPTADQWFTESQFESYRALGQHVIRTLFCEGDGAVPENMSKLDVEDLINRLTTRWNNPEKIQTSSGLGDGI